MIEENIKGLLADILDGRGHYGTVPVETREPSNGVVWYGSPGISASVGMWIRATAPIYMGGHTRLRGLRRYWAAQRDTWDKVPRGPMDVLFDAVSGGPPAPPKFWYFAMDLSDTLHVVGGCTDFSGEGGRAREVAEAYLASFELRVDTLPADSLIDILIEGYGPEAG